MADSMLALTQSVADEHTIIIDNYVKEGCIINSSKSLYGCDHAFYDGHWYSGFAPGTSFLAVPAYLILKPFTYLIPDTFHDFSKLQINLVLLNIIATLLIVIPLCALLSVLIYKFTEDYIKNEKYRILTSFLFSFATLFFYYATEFDSRVLATFFSFAAFYILFRIRTKKLSTSWLFLAGFFAATAVTMEYLQAITLGILSLYLFSFMRNKKLVYFILGAAIPLLLMLGYHYAAFDNPLSTGYNLRQGMDATLNQGLFNDFTLNHLWSYTFSPKYGIFFFMPILLLCVYGLYVGLREKKYFRREWLAIALIFLGYLGVISSFSSDSPLTFGPRYLICIIPFMLLTLPVAIEKLGVMVTMLFGLVSFFINYLPVLYLIENTEYQAGIMVIVNFISEIPQKGFTNYTFNLINQLVMPLDYTLVNVITIGLMVVLGLIIYKIWKN